MNSNDLKTSRRIPRLAGLVCACALLAGIPGGAAAVSISGQTDTIFRLGQSAVEKRDLYPLYEYLRLSVTNIDKNGNLSFHIGGWGRADLADKTTDRYTDTELQYGFLSYRPAQNNLVLNAGRQFVTEGVAAERLDGLYLRSDLAAGFGAALFVGSPVVTEPNFNGGDLVYGGRISHSYGNYYTIGLSALQTDYAGSRLREEEGVDLWLRPFAPVEVVGRSSYNSITSGWMEHAYTVSYTPLDRLRITADLAAINYEDYFYHVTTSALSLTNGILDPREKMLAVGGGVSYTLISALTLAADYRNYGYDIAGDADYFGGKATVTVAGFAAGLSVHRMSGESDRLRYDEYRLFASKKLGKADLTVDFFDINYDRSINGIKNTFSLAGAATYEITDQFKIGADVDYSRNPDFDNEVRGLVKISYVFDATYRAEGGGKSEK